MTAFVYFLVMFLGFIIGVLYSAVSQLHNEHEYIKTGIAKIYGKYYRISPYMKEAKYE